MVRMPYDFGNIQYSTGNYQMVSWNDDVTKTTPFDGHQKRLQNELKATVFIIAVKVQHNHDSGATSKRTKMYKEMTRYESDAKIDFELGVISKEEYKVEMKAIRGMKRAKSIGELLSLLKKGGTE